MDTAANDDPRIGDEERTVAAPVADVISAKTATAILVAVTLFVVGLLGWALWSAAHAYGSGIDLIVNATNYNPTAGARRIFLLAGGMQITMFKVIAFGISTLLALVGGVFILNGSRTAYQLNLSQGDAKAALASTSPGLVIMTLAMGLAAVTLHSKSDIADHYDLDLPASSSALSAPPEASAAPTDYIAIAQAALNKKPEAVEETKDERLDEAPSATGGQHEQK